MRVRLLALPAALILATASAPQDTRSPYAIKIAPENDHVNPLPLTSADAFQRYGQLSSEQSRAVSVLADQLVGKARGATDNNWQGPPLFLSHSTEQYYEGTDLLQLRGELDGRNVTLFDPYSLGRTSEDTAAVVMAKIENEPNARAKWVAIAFVFHNGVVQRIVVAPQPWITLMPPTVHAPEGGN